LSCRLCHLSAHAPQLPGLAKVVLVASIAGQVQAGHDDLSGRGLQLIPRHHVTH
jgi:hypothetical protein